MVMQGSDRLIYVALHQLVAAKHWHMPSPLYRQVFIQWQYDFIKIISKSYEKVILRLFLYAEPMWISVLTITNIQLLGYFPWPNYKTLNIPWKITQKCFSKIILWPFQQLCIYTL
jgi:hypothetical protein